MQTEQTISLRTVCRVCFTAAVSGSGVVTTTSLDAQDGRLLDDVVARLSFGGIVGDLGLIAGVNLMDYGGLVDGLVETSRKARLFVDVNFVL